MDIELIPLCTIEIVLGDQVFVGSGPAGLRVIAEVASGKVRGDRVRGSLRPHAGADWLTINGTVGTVDVRSTLETDDGAVVYVTYGGRIDLTDGPGAAPIYMAPRFETGDERYAWLNTVQAVGKGELVGSDLSYVLAEVR